MMKNNNEKALYKQGLDNCKERLPIEMMGGNEIEDKMELFESEDDCNLIRIQISRWHSFDKSYLIECKNIEGNIFSDLKQVSTFLKNHIVITKRFYAGGCDYVYSYPMETVYQALYVCLMRKDLNDSSPIQVDIFQNRMEFSCKTNQQLNLNIIKILKKQGLIIDDNESIKYLEANYKRELNQSIKINEEERDQTIILENTYYKPVTLHAIKKLRISAKKCYDMIYHHPGIRLTELSKLLEKPYITVQTEVRVLRRKQLVERRGTREQGGYYCIEIEIK